MFIAGGTGLMGWVLFSLPAFFRAAGGPGAGSAGGGYIDPRFKRILWYLIASSRGGVNRATIIDLVNSRPANANQIASELKLDYKTVLHHLSAFGKRPDNHGQQGDVRRHLLFDAPDGKELCVVPGDIGQNWEKVN